jgi:hypothetical protein
MPTYKNLNPSSAKVTSINDDYKTKVADPLKVAQGKSPKDQGTIDRLKILAEPYEHEVKEILDDDMRTLKASFETHQRNIDALVKASLDDLKAAKETTASYKAKPRSELPPQVEFFTKRIKQRAVDAAADAKSFGDAWKGYRENVAKNMPEAVIDGPETIRKDVINRSKITGAKILQISSAGHEAEAQLEIVHKATRKRVDKTDRPIAEAQQAAKNFSKKMADLLAEAQNPPTRSTQPNSIRSNSSSLVENAANKSLTANPRNLSDSEGRWATTDASWKGLNTRATAMANVLTNTQKGFRSTELADAVVKGEMVKANKSLADIKLEVKQYAPMYAKAQKAITTIRAAFKNKKK